MNHFVTAPVTQAIAWRIAAIVPFAIAAGANAMYPAVSHGASVGVSTFATIGLSVVALSGAWVGVLLLIHGRRLFRPHRAVKRRRATDDPLRALSSTMFADRHAMAQMLTAQALARAAQRRRDATDHAGPAGIATPAHR